MSSPVVMITGAAGGIGRELSRAFADAGAALVLGDIVGTAARALADELEQNGVQALGQACDVTREDDVVALVDAALEAHGRLDVAVNNAGVTHLPADVGAFSTDEFDRVIAVNLRGTFLGMRHQLPVMLQQRDGVVVNIASVLGCTGFAGAAAYVAAKHGVVGLTKTAALETASNGLRVNAICPGFIETPMVTSDGLAAGRGTDIFAEIEAMHPIGRIGQPEEVAAAGRLSRLRPGQIHYRPHVCGRRWVSRTMTPCGVLSRGV